MIGLQAINGATIDGSVVQVRPTCTTDYNSATSIFIKHVTEGTTINDFLPIISKFGTVLSAYVRDTLVVDNVNYRFPTIKFSRSQRASLMWTFPLQSQPKQLLSRYVILTSNQIERALRFEILFDYVAREIRKC